MINKRRENNTKSIIFVYLCVRIKKILCLFLNLKKDKIEGYHVVSFFWYKYYIFVLFINKNKEYTKKKIRKNTKKNKQEFDPGSE